MDDLTLHRVPFVHLYSDLSYRDFFQRYNPKRDGKVYAATYSFGHKQMEFWWRFEPTSTIYVSEKYEKQAESFIRRFPLFEVRAVKKLHTKAVFFERSGVLLLGSENIYAPESTFLETSIETLVPESEKQKVIDLVFRRIEGRTLRAKFTMNDLRIWRTNGKEFRPFLPCHHERPYWDLFGPPLRNSQNESDDLPSIPQHEFLHRWIYMVSVFHFDGTKIGLAFDRGYTYCGDIDSTALEWLLTNCEVLEKRKGAGPIQQDEETLLKDRFYSFHPIAGQQASETDYWLGPVKAPNSFQHLQVNLKNS